MAEFIDMTAVYAAKKEARILEEQARTLVRNARKDAFFAFLDKLLDLADVACIVVNVKRGHFDEGDRARLYFNDGQAPESLYGTASGRAIEAADDFFALHFTNTLYVHTMNVWFAEGQWDDACLFTYSTGGYTFIHGAEAVASIKNHFASLVARKK